MVNFPNSLPDACEEFLVGQILLFPVPQAILSITEAPGSRGMCRLALFTSVHIPS